VSTTVTRTNLATNPSFEASGSTAELRRNYVENPRAVSATTGWGYQTGTGESTTVTNSNATGPGQLPGMITATVTTAKTAGNSGFYRNETISGVTNDSWTASVWVRSSVAITLGLNVTVKSAGATVTVASGPQVTLVANTWSRLSATVTSTGAYDTVQAWAIMNSGQILPAAATFDAAQMLIEAGTVVGSYFDGDYPAPLRTNWAKNPEAVTSATGFGVYQAGTGETGTTTFVSGASDGPIPAITTYGRQAVTAAKTAGSTGWLCNAGTYRGPAQGNAGDTLYVSVWVRSSVATSIIMKAYAYTKTGTSINSADSGTFTLPANTWVRVSSSVVAAADYDSIAWFAYMPAATILPVGATLDATGSLLENAPSDGSYFSGTTASTSGITYAWFGTANNSASLLLDNDLTFAWTGTADASASTLTVRKVTGVGGSGLTYRSSWWANNGTYSLRQPATGLYSEFGITGLTPGQTYTVMATSYSTAPIVGTGNRRMVQIRAYSSANATPLTVVAPAGTVGAYTHTGTFVCPSDATSYAVRFTPDQSGGTDVWWDSAMVVPGTYTGPYFDGNTPPFTNTAYTPAAQTSFTWTGAVNGSTSVQTDIVPLQNYQVQLPGAVIVGAGTGVNLLSVTGLRDLAAIRSGDESRPLADGAYPGLAYLGERVLTIKWDLTMAAGLETGLQVLSAGFQNVPDPSAVCMTAGDYLRQQAGIGATKPVSALQLQLPGRAVALMVFGRPTKHAVPIDLDYQWGQAHPVSEWTSPDGVIYDATVVPGTTTLPSPTSGLTWAAAFPWTFGSSAGGSLSLSNSGNYPANPLFVIQGPVSYPKITNTVTGQFVYLNIVLGAADTLVVDHQAGTVTLNATANRNNAVAAGSSFFTLAPGTTSVGFSSADSSAVAGTLTGYLLPTYSTV
jgi:hypothetical protein